MKALLTQFISSKTAQAMILALAFIPHAIFSAAVPVPCDGCQMTLDGQFIEPVWTLSAFQSIPVADCTYVNNCGATDTNATAQYKIAWNSTALYLAVSVSDPGTLFANAGAPWNGSGVEIFFDYNNTKGGYTNPNYNDANTYQWCITYNANSIVEFHNAMARSISASSSVTVGTGYNMEIEIPWANLGVTGPPVGLVSGIDVAIDVANAAGTQRDHQLAAFSPTTNLFDQKPATWGDADYSACLTPTPTYSPTASPTATLTFTKTWTPTLSPTLTVSPSLTASPTLTLSATPTWTPSLSPTITLTPTPTWTLTLSPTITLSATPTWTPSLSSTLTLSATPTWTPTLSSTLTLSATPTWTPTLSSTLTLSATPTWTPSLSSTLTLSATPTWTPSLSPTLSMSATQTWTRTLSSTLTLSATPTWTPSLSPTLTLSPTPSSTPSLSPSLSPTATQSPNLSPTFTLTTTVTLSFTSTATQTPTLSSSPTGSSTSTLTTSPSATATSTASLTVSPTPTPTVTSDATVTLTSSVTSTSSWTATPTHSGTGSPSPSFTVSATISLTASPTATYSHSPTNTPSSTATKTATMTASPTQPATFSPTPTKGSPIVSAPPQYNLLVLVFDASAHKIATLLSTQVAAVPASLMVSANPFFEDGSRSLTVTTSGADFTATWNGIAPDGQRADQGVYTIQAVYTQISNGVVLTREKSFTLLWTGNNLISSMVLAPNPAGQGQSAHLFWAPRAGFMIRAKIYDLAGELIMSQAAESSIGTLSWDLKGSSRSPVADGIYIWSVESMDSGGHVVEQGFKKLVVLRR